MSELENQNNQNTDSFSANREMDITNPSVSTVADSTKTTETQKPKKKENILKNIEILAKPQRILPAIIEELLEKNIPVTLSKEGYFVGGFYGINENLGKTGFALAQETSEENTLVLIDSKNNRHVVKSFEDMVRFHNHVWSMFFKVSEDYKRPDPLWFGYMLEYGVLNITPGK